MQSWALKKVDRREEGEQRVAEIFKEKRKTEERQPGRERRRRWKTRRPHLLQQYPTQLGVGDRASGGVKCD